VDGQNPQFTGNQETARIQVAHMQLEAVGACHYWNKNYFRDLCRNKPRINPEYLRIE
jgi:hypothetical protein